MIELVENEQVELLESRGADIVKVAAEFNIQTAEDLTTGSQVLGVIKAIRAEVAETFDEPIAAAHAAHKSIISARKKIEQPLITAEVVVKKTISGYHDELRRAADEERRAAEAKRRAQEEESRLAAAVILEEAGKSEVAEAIIEAPVEVATPMITTPPPPKTAGVTTSVKYRGVVTDLYSFVAWALATHSLADYLTVKQGEIDRMCQRKKGDVSIPGFEVRSETVVTTRKA